MTDWIPFLAARGARFAADGATIAGFSDCPEDTAQTSVLCDLSELEVLAFTGEDAGTFLQGQLTCDVRLATSTQSRRGALCTPKGRALATFRLWAQRDGFCMVLPAALADAIRRRLSLYVLRARVRIAPPEAATVRIGIAGPDAALALALALGIDRDALPHRDGVLAGDGATVIALPGERFLVCAAQEAAPALWERLATRLTEAAGTAWAWRALEAGDADVLPATQDQFVPQMLNLDLDGGIGFSKGCYTGQEIVARTQHLGRLKQRLYRCHLASGPAPAAGTALYSPDFEGQATGTVLAAAPRPDGRVVVLAVLRVDTVAAGLPVHCGTPDGAPLRGSRQVDADLPPCD